MLLEGIGASLKVVLSQYKNETFYSLVALITFFLQSPFQWILRGQPPHPKKETATYMCPKNQQTQTHTHSLSIPFLYPFLFFILSFPLFLSRSFSLNFEILPAASFFSCYQFKTFKISYNSYHMIPSSFCLKLTLLCFLAVHSCFIVRLFCAFISVLRL